MAQRIDLIVELIEYQTEAPFRNLTALLLRAQELAKTRNLIAHNPLVLDIYEHPDGDIQVKENIVSLLKDNYRISLSELEQFSSEAEQLATDLYVCATEVFSALKA
ncbi:hypothetical protein [Novimethylophilus kurashikiensis]|uniref:hypothetical protein n=1 Tax=Novimethylophilus kurashikiensis TaxID=1825523 RepID=UPI0011B20EF7|nr:hypothetical protein [Novimethylophilus kurashikiensis]